MKSISPSLMCVDIFKLRETLRIFEEKKIEYLHMDVMDGSFVPNITLGIDYIKSIRKESNIPLDIHLMIDGADDKLEWFDFKEGEVVSIHVEGIDDLDNAVKKLKELKCKVLFAIKPKTDVTKYFKYLSKIDGFLIMTVEPGFAGQSLKEETLEKISICKQYFERQNYADKILEVDGNVSYINAERMSKMGANMFVAGTSSFLAKDSNIVEGINEFRKRIG